jgi:ribosome-associated toxin RatA of RatAB toxin-antitoxin module
MKASWLFLAGVILAIAVPSFGDVPPMALGENEMAQLCAGRVLVSSIESKKGFVQAAILLDVPVEKVWDLIVDCPSAAKSIRNLKRCTILERHEGWDIIEQQVTLSWFLPDIHCRFRADYTELQQIYFKIISGDLKELEGRWSFHRAGGGAKTILVYSVYVNPGFFVPQRVIRWILEVDLPDLLISIRNHFSGSVPP